MIVCVCKRISDRQIQERAQQGQDFEEISFELGVATQCGCCRECAQALVKQCQSRCLVEA